MKYIVPLYFIISLSIGLFLVYITSPPPNVIVVYPTPDNHNQYQYQDKAENCFVINQSEMTCPESKDDVITVPMQ